MAEHPIFADDMQEIVESFIVESREIFEGLDHDLLQLERTPDDRELIDRIFRGVHTVKGTSGFLSLEQMSELAHKFEDVLNQLRQGELEFYPAMMDVLFAAFDQMNVLLDRVVEGNMEPVDQEDVLADLQAILDGTLVDEAAPATEEASEDTAETEASQATDDAVDASADAEPEETSAEANPPEAQAAPASEDPSSEENDAPASEAKDATPEATNKSQQRAKKRLTDRASETIRVEVDRLDTLMDLVGELVLGRNRLLQLVSDAESIEERERLLRELGDTTSQVDFITSELQSAVMRTRMVQVGRVFNKFPRVVRDLAREFDKKIDLVIEGEDTELDKSLVEEIGDPLTHLIRNAADHGIEMPETRREQGKPERGQVRLSAAHEGNHILIEIEDDGAGIDPDALRKKAVEKGVVSEQEAADLTDAEAFDLIFRPGFSTAKGLSQVSGRGVGMDVVKTNLRRLNGSIDIDSTPGEGTRFTMKLPLTLAIIQSLLVDVGAEKFAIPLHSVTEVVSLDEQEVYTMKGREVMRHRDRVLPLMRIGETLDVTGHTRNTRHAYVVVVAIAHHRLGVVVDDLISQEEIVIKPLGNYLKKVDAVAGSTILGDGSVIMILDIGELIRMRVGELRSGAGRGPSPSEADPAEQPSLEPA